MKINFVNSNNVRQTVSFETDCESLSEFISRNAISVLESLRIQIEDDDIDADGLLYELIGMRYQQAEEFRLYDDVNIYVDIDDDDDRYECTWSPATVVGKTITYTMAASLERIPPVTYPNSQRVTLETDAFGTLMSAYLGGDAMLNSYVATIFRGSQVIGPVERVAASNYELKDGDVVSLVLRVSKSDGC